MANVQKCVFVASSSHKMSKIFLPAILFSWKYAVKPEVQHFMFSDRARQKLTGFLWFFVFFNMAKFCQILTLFAQVMTSEANGTN